MLSALGPLAHESVDQAQRRPIRYISARRAHAEPRSVLAGEGFPQPHPPLNTPTPAPPSQSQRPPGAPPKVRVQDLLLANLYDEVVQPFVAEGAGLVRQWRAHVSEGAPRPTARPPELINIGQDCMPEWARGVVWDCRDPEDRRPLAPSRGHPVAAKCISAQAFCTAAAELGYPDLDIIAQLSDGGVRANHDRLELKTVLAWHHGSATKHFAAADSAMLGDLSNGWLPPATPGFHLPFIPCRLVPKGVALQPKVRRLPDGSVEEWLKARVTTDDSFPRDGSSPNAAVPADQAGILLPRPTDLARAAAIAASSGLTIGLYAIDCADAYRYMIMQALDQWTQCTLWADGVHVEPRGVFGQAFMPNRFQRASMLAVALARKRQREFDARFPPPAPPAWWLDRRTDGGSLSYAHVYIDDTCGCSTTDIIPRSQWPPELLAIDLGEGPYPETAEGVGPWRPRPWAEAAALAGGEPAHPESRVAIHARIAVGVFRGMKFDISTPKLQISNRIIQLGFSTELDAQRLRVPEAKKEAMLSLVRQLRSPALAPRELVDRLVGRLAHVAHVLPGLLSHLHAGYSMTKAMVHRRSAGGEQVRHRPRWLRVQGNSDAQAAFQLLLDVAESMLSDNDGVPLAVRRVFPDPIMHRLPLIVTDASGVVGFGGWTIRGDELLAVGEPWPPSIAVALASRSQFSVAAAELFTIGATAAALAVQGPWAVAVGDSQAAAGAVDKGSSSVAGMRAVIAILRAATPGTAWLCAHVPRDVNWVADALSKLEFERVRSWAASLGLRLAVLPTPEWVLEALLAAVP